ncbi:MAG: DeoR family transcriptional regulator [Chloroflexi bacterium]|nr:DeoR family transcriptional regulator [Chloroflexota bacterium]
MGESEDPTPSGRRTRIQELLNKHGRVRVAELVTPLGVTDTSIRRDLPKELGASIPLDVGKHDLQQLARDKGFKPDLAIIAAPVLLASELALELVQPGGSLLLFSGYPFGPKMSLGAYRLRYAEEHIRGRIDGNIRDFQNAVGILPRLHVGRLITETFPLKDTPRAFRAARSSEAAKTMIESRGPPNVESAHLGGRRGPYVDIAGTGSDRAPTWSA